MRNDWKLVRGWVGALVALSLVACGGGGGGDGAAEDTAGPRDVPTLPDTARQDVRLDAPNGKDAGAEDVPLLMPGTGAPRAFGAACATTDDCDSGWCVPWDEGFACSDRCLGTCPAGWECRAVPNTWPDVAFVCHWQESFLCQPCAEDAQCGDGACVSLADGPRCGRPCREDGSCPTGFVCEERPSAATATEVRQCVPQSGRCDCTQANRGEQRACEIANDSGTCRGVQECEGVTGWSACTASVPAPEDCNGVDDDCDGAVDEDPAEPAEACARSNEFGTCTGSWVCRGVSGWECTVMGDPEAERCDLRDNDCDGQTDEDFREAGGARYVDDLHCGACNNGCTGRFPNGTAACATPADPEGTPECVITACAAGFFQAGPATCLPVTTSLCLPCVQDDNCAVPGDRCVPIEDGTYCGRDCGEASLHGTECPPGYACTDVEGDGRQCVPLSGSCACTPENADMQRRCERVTEYGTCHGVHTCDPFVGWGECNAPAAVPEVCDGADNDCDGFVDEDVTAPGEPCSTTWTAPDGGESFTCLGEWRCATTDAGTDWVCTAPQAGPEICDGVDNDCDGTTDEDFRDPETLRYAAFEHCGVCGFSCAGMIPNATVRCDGSKDPPTCVVDACAEGFYPLGESACLPITDPSCQPCGSDANCRTPGSACLILDDGRWCGRDCAADNLYGAAEGECPDGYLCAEQADGRRLCRPETAACTCFLPEQAGAERPCAVSNEWGTCSGLETCDPSAGGFGGWGGCTAATPGAETCDGVDNDCDGLVDEGAPPPPEPCAQTNEWGTCAADWQCRGGDGWHCSAGTPAEDLCDYQDNDCDGGTDEDFRDGGAGPYTAFDHCGLCNYSCEGTVLNAVSIECQPRGDGARCVPTECDPGYFSPSTNDRVCIPEGTAVDCQPCSGPDQCSGLPSGQCQVVDAASFCIRGCADDSECVEGFRCRAGRCWPNSLSCTCLPGNERERRPCELTNLDGTCSGFQECAPALVPGWSVCDAEVPSAEECNGVDDNCNGLVDEGVGHDPPTCARVNQWGTCPGTWVCADGGGFRDWVCVAETAGPEMCDGEDDDCDGLTDETFADLLGPCAVGVGACRRFGVRECAEDGQRTVCNAAPGEPSDEVCNGLDDDCDGLSDEGGGWLDRGTVCVAGLGVCARAGVKVCDPADPAAPTACSAAPGQASDELCNGLDDDCDGQTDEEARWTELGRPCTAGEGVCRAVGVYTCDPADRAGALLCNARPPAGGSEICNGLDDDCDGQTDEPAELAAPPCAEQDGVCAGSVRTCRGSAGWTSCNGPEYGDRFERTEVSCDGADNDCDGVTDEDLSPPPCQLQTGVCGGSVKTCGGAAGWRPCVTAQYGPLYEAVEATCDYLDNDCDGAVDDGFRVDGRYVGQDHCGVCGNSCTGSIPNAVAFCDGESNPPHCAVESCAPGYLPFGAYGCASPTVGLCDPCQEDDNCPLPGAVCLALDDGAYCANPCDAAGACPSGYTCTDLGATDVCVPDTNACQCDGTNLTLTRGCQSQYPPDGDPEYFCDGTRTCAEDGWSACDLPDETCDGFDDDCDGLVDEGFVDGDGRYTSNANCGGCGNDCTGIDLPGGAATCDTVQEPPACRFACAGTCFDVNENLADGCECCDPQPVDPPDPLGRDEDCDGMDGERDNGIFVAKDGDDGADGAYGRPKRTVQAGVDAAAAAGLPYVYVATGVYAEAVRLRAGVRVYGGYDSDFGVRDAILYQTAILSPQPTAELPGAINALDLRGGAAGSVAFDGFSVFGHHARTQGASSYAIYVRDCDATVRIANNRVHAGTGGDGLRGADGNDGANGRSGGAGTAALDLWFTYGIQRDACTSQHWTLGGAGGTSTCGGVPTNGGPGGDRDCPTWDGATTATPSAIERGRRGADGGVATGGGAGGDAGWDVWHQSYQCEGYERFGDVEGREGGDGAGGVEGTAGGACSPSAATVTEGRWTPATAGAGTAGTAGSGGGGGGSGGGAAAAQSCFAHNFGYDNLGGTGGGGGAGGCGGTGGTGGTGGGGAFAVFVVFTTTPSSVPTIVDNGIHGGVGGVGGAGGNGGVSGNGGNGAAGGAGGGTGEEQPADPTYPAFKGGKGGNGGNGGHGGGGGGGCGGPAYGIYAWGVAPAALAAWKDGNDFVGAGQGGAGGLGGFSLGRPGEDGTPGAVQDTNF